MSERFEIKQNEHGMVRLFVVDLPEEAIEGFAEGGLTEALGVARLDPEGVELFALENLQGVGLAGYMVDGLGIAEADVTPDKARLDALTGHLLVLRSRAFGGQSATLTPRAPLRWIGTYPEENAPVKFEPLPSEAAKGQVVPEGKPRPSDAAMSGRVAMIALLVIFALTALMIWIAAS